MQSMEIHKKIMLVEKLIESGEGDTGRLNYIRECLEKHKPLFKTDQRYLEQKLEAITPTPAELPTSDNRLSSIKQMLDLGFGDKGRITHIFETLKNGKNLFKSDQIYLEKKLEAFIKSCSFSKIPSSVLSPAYS